MLVKKSNRLIAKRVVRKRNGQDLNVRIRKIEFYGDTLIVYLTGERVLEVPLSKFPEIKKLSQKQRNKYHISGGISLDFDDSDEVYHLNELIGIGTT